MGSAVWSVKNGWVEGGSLGGCDGENEESGTEMERLFFWEEVDPGDEEKIEEYLKMILTRWKYFEICLCSLTLVLVQHDFFETVKRSDSASETLYASTRRSRSLCYAMQFQHLYLKPKWQRWPLLRTLRHLSQADVRYTSLYCVRYHIRIVPERRMYLLIWPTSCPLLASSHSTRRRYQSRRYRSCLLISPSSPLLAQHLLPRTTFHLSLLNELIIVPGLIRGLPLPHFHDISRLALL